MGRGSHLAPRRANVQGAGRTVPVHSARREWCRGCRGCRGKIRRRRRVAFGSDVARFGPPRDADAPGIVVYTLFAARDDIVLQESHPVPAGFESLLGVAVPSLFVCRKSALEEGGGVCFSVTMRDFLGMERADAETRAALLDFNYNLAVGNSDAAFAAVKTIKNPDVWENMAHMCIKNKRLDVAETCLGNMGHVRGARAVRDAAEEPELDARVAAVAVHLGLTDEAERLYRGCDRHDLLNRLYQASGRWKDAVALASKRDRIHLKTTHYNHAKHLESVGDLQGAIRAYERAGCASAEVPRLLHSRGLTEELERYVASAADAKLTKWWARFANPSGDLERALDAYRRRRSSLARARVLLAGCVRRRRAIGGGERRSRGGVSPREDVRGEGRCARGCYIFRPRRSVWPRGSPRARDGDGRRTDAPGAPIASGRDGGVRAVFPRSR